MKGNLSRTDRCELTDHYEAAILHKTPLHVRWEQHGTEKEQRLMPMDLRCDHGKDYLLVQGNDGDQLWICLDQINDVREFKL